MEEELVTSYMYCPNTGKYLGVFEFPKVQNQPTVYLPPHTTLVKPPEAEGDMYPHWNNTDWVLKKVVEKKAYYVRQQDVANLGSLARGYVLDNISMGLWPESMLAQYEDAVKKLQK